MRKYKNKMIIMSVLCVTLLGSMIQAQGKEVIDVTDLTKGIVSVSYKSPQNKNVKVVIEKGQDKYTYNLNASGKEENFPLQLGNGKYKVSVLESTTGNKYRMISAKDVNLNLADSKNVYLNSIQGIEFKDTMAPIKKASELKQKAKSVDEVVNAIHQYIVQGYKYNYTKLATLPNTYLPNIEKTYEEKNGICYDFSSLYASMLRSQGVPVKLAKGYTPNAEGYHAWNEVYDEKTKQWLVIDTTYDAQAFQKKVATDRIKKTKDYQKVKEY